MFPWSNTKLFHTIRGNCQDTLLSKKTSIRFFKEFLNWKYQGLTANAILFD